ncbi:hypothetical protein ACWGDX_19280 [Streptomyces sp. NPDC055025]
MVFTEVGELVTECGEAGCTGAVAAGDARFLIAVTPLGGGFQELVQGTERTVPVAQDRFGHGLELRGTSGVGELVGPGGDVLPGLGHGQGVGELPRVVCGPAVEVVAGWGVGVVGVDLFGGTADVVVQLEVGMGQGSSWK